MALDATVGGTDSNSYVTVAEADTYFCGHPFYSVNWNDLTEAQKESYLMMATRVLTTLCWTGAATSAEQSLAWPRTGMKGAGGWPLSDSAIPKEIKYMTYEMANKLRADGTVASSSTSDQGLKRVKAGSVEIEYFNPQDIT